MTRRPIYPPRHTLYVLVSMEVADALSTRAQAEQLPQRAIVEAALRAYLLDADRAVTPAGPAVRSAADAIGAPPQPAIKAGEAP